MSINLNCRTKSEIEYGEECPDVDSLALWILDHFYDVLEAHFFYNEGELMKIEVCNLEKLREFSEKLPDGFDGFFHTYDSDETEEWRQGEIEDAKAFFAECVKNAQNTDEVAIIDVW